MYDTLQFQADRVDEVLRDQLVCGLRHETTQKHLLSVDNLTLDKAVQLAQSMEAADMSSKSLKDSGSASAPVNQVPSGKRHKCYRCGKTGHGEKTCRYREAECHHCHKKGHIASVCRSKAPGSKQGSRTGKKTPGSHCCQQPTTQFTHNIDRESDQESEQGDELPLYTIGSIASKPICVGLQVNGSPITMEVDTGAAVSLISEETRKKLLPAATLHHAPVRLRTYTGEMIKVLGQIDADVVYEGQQKSLKLMVVAGQGPSLLGRNWLQHITLNWKQIKAVLAQPEDEAPELSTLLNQYEDIFENGLGAIQHHEARIKVQDKATPFFFRARPVPYSLRVSVEQELNWLLDQGILERVEHSEWASPIVVVPKPNSKIRLC